MYTLFCVLVFSVAFSPECGNEEGIRCAGHDDIAVRLDKFERPMVCLNRDFRKCFE